MMKIRKYNENVEDLNTTEWYYELRAYDLHGSRTIKNSEYHVVDWETELIHGDLDIDVDFENQLNVKNVDLFRRLRDWLAVDKSSGYTYVVVKITVEVVD